MNDQELPALSSEPVKNHLLRLTGSKAIIDRVGSEVYKI